MCSTTSSHSDHFPTEVEEVVKEKLDEWYETVIKFGAAKDEVIKDLEKNQPMFTLLDKLSKELDIECTSMSGLIEKYNYQYKDLETYYIAGIIDLAKGADVLNLIDEAKTLEAYKKLLDELDPQS